MKVGYTRLSAAREKGKRAWVRLKKTRRIKNGAGQTGFATRKEKP